MEDFTSDGDKNLTNKALNVETICENILTALKVEIKEKKIRITTDLKVRELVFPKSSLRSVLYNLIHNAVKFSDPNKKSTIKITTTVQDEFVVLSVLDNGIGIPLEHQERVFEKALRLSKTIRGTGMGLYVVKKMIEDNAGRIELKSKENEGTTFNLFFKNAI